MTKAATIYGGSLYDLAASEGLTEEIAEQSGQLRQLFRENPDYMRLLTEPSIPFKERCSLMDEAFAGANRYLVNFIKLLCERGLLREYAQCCEEFTRRYNADHNIATAVVTSAVALTEEQTAALTARLEKLSGKTVKLETRTDSSCIGGIRVELEGKQLDGTVQGRLAGISRKLSELTV